MKMEEEKVEKTVSDIEENSSPEQAPVIKENEIKKEENSEPTVFEIEKPKDGDKPFEEIVEEERKVLLANEKRARTVSTVTMVVVLGCAIGAVVLLQKIVVVAYILLGVAVAALIVSFVFNKKIGKPDVQGYIKRSNLAIDKFIFASNEFKNVSYNPAEKITLENIGSDGVYKGIVDVVSRNVIHASFKEEPITVAEVALFKTKTAKKTQTLFVGKYLMMNNNLHFEDRFVLVNENEDATKRFDTPDGLEDLVCLFNDKGFSVYGPKDADYTKVIPAKVIREFRAISIDELLINNILVVWSGKSTLYSSYDDKVISLPFYNPIDTKPYIKFKNDLVKSANILMALGEK